MRFLNRLKENDADRNRNGRELSVVKRAVSAAICINCIRI